MRNCSIICVKHILVLVRKNNSIIYYLYFWNFFLMIWQHNMVLFESNIKVVNETLTKKVIGIFDIICLPSTVYLPKFSFISTVSSSLLI